MFGQTPDLEFEGLAVKTSRMCKPAHVCTSVPTFMVELKKKKKKLLYGCLLWFIFPNPLFKHHFCF